jgi:hypothetical protein
MTCSHSSKDVGHLVWYESINDLKGTCHLHLWDQRLRPQVSPNVNTYLLAYTTLHYRSQSFLHMKYSATIFLLQTNTVKLGYDIMKWTEYSVTL